MQFNNLIYEPYHDLFGFYKEIKTINSGYKLFYNKKEKTIEVININNYFEKCYSFKRIFEINLQDLRFYKIENMKNILNKIDLDNQKINQDNTMSSLNKSKYTLNQFFKISNRSSKINNSDINKIIGATQC